VAFDSDALRAAGYPDPVDVNGIIWPIYKHLAVSIPHSEVERRISDGTVFQWLQTEFGASLPRDEERFLDYLRRAWDVETYNISDHGLLLLHAHCVEAMQQALSILTA
jgi:hypothetical protein